MLLSAKTGRVRETTPLRRLSHKFEKMKNREVIHRLHYIICFTKYIEQYLFGNLLTEIYVFVYLKDITRGETNMKICILSMQRVPNFGSLLQGYSLKKIIEDLGHEVEFIDIQENPDENRLLKDARKNFSFEYGYSRKKSHKIDKYIFNRIITKKRNKDQNHLMWEFQNRIIALNKENNKKKYDCCVIGSDEVFNALNETDWGFTSQLFGNVSQADRVTTYAASCGFTSYSELPGKAKDIIKTSFSKISHFSVRDNNTLEFVKKLSDKEVTINYDPVVVGDFTEEANLEAGIDNLPDKYCIVYAYHDRINNEKEIKAIKSLCKKEGMKIVSVGASQSWIKNHLVITPFQIPEVFSKAQYVVTDTFHGTIFSAKYAKKFAVIVRPSNENKLEDLLEKLNIIDHKVVFINQLNDIYKKEHDLQMMHRIEKRERDKAIQYLKNAINRN